MNNLPQKCPGTHMKPQEENTCPVCDFVWVNVKFTHKVPTHGLVTKQQEKKALGWALNTMEYAV